ncbi:thiol reductant ABC exporter subunit CydC [Ammoniphilus oxalaticus]|uniref:Thiol reductant ABC exporter subunit CydC n=1 Tax=Ammoniphilus oxalaticus TaxID=66863 RepID=A0A419SNG2_9BACL|nr:thiol reductant ABC exporter subunit CydC [Ammoniphilus oxalaticus]RKD25844.1 thiol reductant ABC exporter subunit CydC [Ammoniphilus oxalaticus]
MREWVLPYLNTNRGRMLVSVLLGVLGIGSGAMLLFISGYLISKSALQPVNIMVVYVPIVAVRAFSIGRAVFLYLESLVSHDIVLRILEKMRRKLYDILEPQALFLRSRYQTGDLLSVLSDDIEHLQNLYLRTIFPSVIGLAIYAIVVAVFGSFELIFGVIMALVLGVVVFLIPFLSFFFMRKHHQTRKKERQTLYGKLTDAIFGMADWQASGRTTEFLDEAVAQDAKMMRTERTIQGWHYLRDALTQLVIAVVIIMVVVWSGKQAEINVIAPTIIAAFALMIFSVTDALAPLSEAVERIPTYTDSVERIQAIERTDLPRNYRSGQAWADSRSAKIEIDNISYAYPNSSRDVIDQLSLTIESGEKIAILGRSGTGKSTLLKLLAGAIQPDFGSIRVNGQEMRSGFLSKAVSVLNQTPHLFSTSVANNIRMGRPSATDEDVMKVAEQAQLTTLIASLPDGLHTQMREMGHRFSGGERQRIAFARVLLQDTPIILVDEATIGLDPITEKNLIETMFAAAKDKTIIWVTHHLAGVDQMDKIIFMKEGNLSMQGSHRELMETNQHYKQLYTMDQGDSLQPSK